MSIFCDPANPPTGEHATSALIRRIGPVIERYRRSAKSSKFDARLALVHHLRSFVTLEDQNLDVVNHDMILGPLGPLDLLTRISSQTVAPIPHS